MSIQRVASVLCFLLLISLFDSSTGQAQSIPTEYVNTWDFYGDNAHQVLSIFEDGSFVFFFQQDSGDSLSDEDCTRTVQTAAGQLELEDDTLTLNYDYGHSIQYPNCVFYADGEVNEFGEGSFELDVEYDEYLNYLYLNNTQHSARNWSDTLLESVEVSSGSPIPAEFIGSWSSFSASGSIGLSKTLTLAADGSYTITTVLVDSENDDLNVYQHYEGQASVDGLLLQLEQESAEITYDETETHPDLMEEQHTVWLGFDQTRGYLLYLDGNELRLDGSGGTSPATETATNPFYEDFERNSVAWEESDDNDFVSEINDGVYRIEFDDDSEYLNWVVAPGFDDWDLAPQFDGTYSYQIDMRVSCDGNCIVGVGFGIDEGYQGGTFLYYKNGSYVVQDTYVGEILDDGETNERIDIYDGDWHTLHIEIRRGGFRFAVDGEDMFETRGDVDVAGTIGFQMMREDEEVEIEFEIDNIIVE
jgi:hypothetical protein